MHFIQPLLLLLGTAHVDHVVLMSVDQRGHLEHAWVGDGELVVDVKLTCLYRRGDCNRSTNALAEPI